MGLGKPGGPYVEQLLVPDGWTEADEDQLYKVADDATQALRQLTFDAYDPWQHERTETFNGGNWLGNAAGAANNKAGKHSEEFVAQQNNLVKVVTWNKEVAKLVKDAKEAITHNVEEAQKKIEDIKQLTLFGPLVDALIQAIAIDHVISTYHDLNVTQIKTTADAIPAANTVTSQPKALEQLLNQQQSPAAEAPAGGAPSATLLANPPASPPASTLGANDGDPLSTGPSNAPVPTPANATPTPEDSPNPASGDDMSAGPSNAPGTTHLNTTPTPRDNAASG
ncbi:hypothetical protein [Mycolicibacterium fortuitum]|uniref:hypothetical protein n=1 Tax=Mycolicibacterium fortuitum TaxID=1766 RepID=UPI00096D2E53|nr:hypothetical protein [Mycolicibacterium fortuitum]OMC01586.1 hypothetical protein A5734_16700 [Mycolicibacterium fortuitum]